MYTTVDKAGSLQCTCSLQLKHLFDPSKDLVRGKPTLIFGNLNLWCTSVFANLIEALRTCSSFVCVSLQLASSSSVAPKVTVGEYVMIETNKAIESPNEESDKPVGLKNQGTTGWLSVVLQVFYHIKVLRKVRRCFSTY